MGLQTSRNASDAPSQWRAYKKTWLDPHRSEEEKNKEMEKQYLKQGNWKFKSKTDYCVEWIESKAEETKCDKFATEQGANDEGELKNIEVLPWSNRSVFYDEFEIEEELKGKAKSQIPSRDCFYDALKRLKPRMRLMKCKGNAASLIIYFTYLMS